MSEQEDREDRPPQVDLVVRPRESPGDGPYVHNDSIEVKPAAEATIDDATARLEMLVLRWQRSHRRGAPRFERLDVEAELLLWRR